MARTLFAFCFAVAALTACGEPESAVIISGQGENAVSIEPAIPGPFADTAAEPVATPAPAPDGPYFETPKAGEELPSSMTTPGPIPTAFRHVWAIEKQDCKADPGLTRIAVAPGAIRFYESRAVVVTANTSLEGTVALKVDQTAEGTTTREAHTLALNPAKTELTYDRNGQAFTYKRCD